MKAVYSKPVFVLKGTLASVTATPKPPPIISPGADPS